MRVKISGMLVFILATILLSGMFSGCANTNNNSLMQDDSASEITVKVCQLSTKMLESAATRFEKDTGVKVTIKNCLEEDSEDFGYGKYAQTITSELMAGRGADIYGLSLLDYQGFGKNGLLCDFTESVKTDPDLSDKAVFQRVLTAAKGDDGLYVIPIDVDATAVIGYQGAPELSTVPQTWDNFYNALQQTSAKGKPIAINDLRAFMLLYHEHRGTLIDEKAKTVDMEGFKALFDRVDGWREHGVIYALGDERTGIEPFGVSVAGSDILPTISGYPTANNMGAVYYMLPTDDLTQPMQLSSDSLYGVSMGSQCKGTAYKFLKYCISEEFQTYWTLELEEGGLPINRAIFHQLAEKKMTYAKTKNEAVDVSSCVKNLEAFMNSDFQGIDSSLAMILSLGVDQTVKDVSKAYFRSEITEDEALTQLKDKITLHLQELG